MSKDKDCIFQWKGLVIIWTIWFIVHFGGKYLVEELERSKLPPQIINSFEVSNIRIGINPIDKFFRVAKLSGSVKNVSSYLKTNIVITVELLDRNGVKIGTKEIDITSLAPSEKYKIKEYVWNKNVKSYKVRNITTK